MVLFQNTDSALCEALQVFTFGSDVVVLWKPVSIDANVDESGRIVDEGAVFKEHASAPLQVYALKLGSSLFCRTVNATHMARWCHEPSDCCC